MATALTAEGRNLVSKHLLGDSATTYPGAGQCYLSVHSAQPGNAGSSQLGSRVACAMTYDAVNKWFTNSSPASISGATGTIYWAALWHSAGTGNVRFEGAVTTPITIPSGGSALIPANSLRIYATPPDGSHKGGFAEKGAELVLGHFLGVASWAMPTSFGYRTHSASAGVTGNANVLASFSGGALKPFEYSTADRFLGQAYQAAGYSGNSRFWSATDASGNALCYGEVSTGEQAWADFGTGSGQALNHVDASGAADSTVSDGSRTATYTALRVSFEIPTVISGNVNSGVITMAQSMALTAILTLKAPVTTLSSTMALIVSVGSTTQARVSMAMSMRLQIGDSAPGVGFCWQTLLYPSKLSLQTLESD